MLENMETKIISAKTFLAMELKKCERKRNRSVHWRNYLATQTFSGRLSVSCFATHSDIKILGNAKRHN